MWVGQWNNECIWVYGQQMYMSERRWEVASNMFTVIIVITFYS